MRKLFRLLLPVTVGLVVTDCGDAFGPITGLPRELSVAEAHLIEADNRFAFKLFREITAQEKPDKNIFISPLSVAMALGMTYNGAAGTTQEAMQRTLELEGMTLQEVNESYRSVIDLLAELDPRVEFLLANSIWYREKLTPRQEFLDVNRRYFDAEVSGLDFADPGAAETINSWVDENTRGKITKIVPATIPPYVVMYLINAIYFKGDWTYQFDKNQTRDAAFTLADGSETTVKMMSRESEHPVQVFSDENVQVVDLPYGGKAYSMTIVLPLTPQGIHALAGDLTQESWDRWLAGLDSTSLFVSVPKFTLEYEINLNDVLVALGMGEAFTGGADFSRMYEGGGVWIDEVKHKSFVDVNEEGTEAAAVTSVRMIESAPPVIYVDRPFLFAIREDYSGTILFMGRMMDPTAG